jgi:ankyrin repeat protein
MPKRSVKKYSAKRSAKKHSAKKHSAKKHSAKKHSAKKHSVKKRYQKRYQKGSGVIRKRDEEDEEDKYIKFLKTYTHHYDDKWWDENKNTVTSNFSSNSTSNSSSNSSANLDNLPPEMILRITENMKENDDIYKLYKGSERMKRIYNSNKNYIEKIIMRNHYNAIKDLEKTDKKYMTPLMYALYYKKPIEIIKLLLNKGANVNAEREYEIEEEGYEINGTTPLMLALESNKELKYNDNDLMKIVKLLLDNGANVNYIDYDDHTPLVYAIEYAPIEVIKIILDKTNDELVNLEEELDLGRTPLMHALFYERSIEIIKLLLNKGANINYENKLGITPLMIALDEENSIDIIKFLLDNGANVNDKDYKGIDVLTWASRNPIEIIQLLLDRGARVNMKTIIHFASNKDISSEALYLVLKYYTPS